MLEPTTEPLIIRFLAKQDYAKTWKAMQDFTQQRDENTPDEVWLVEHPPIFTLGQNGKREHILDPGEIPIEQVDRGGQVTYHGPGQLVAYVMVNIQRRHLGVRRLVTLLEQTIIAVLNDYHIQAVAHPSAPGVYVNDAKICSIGLRVRRGCSYHGLALNVNMDLAPFARINPCGYAGLRMTQLSEHVSNISLDEIKPRLIHHLAQQLGYNQLLIQREHH